MPFNFFVILSPYTPKYIFLIISYTDITSQEISAIALSKKKVHFLQLDIDNPLTMW